MLLISIIFVGLVTLFALAAALAHWLIHQTDIGLYLHARYLNARRPLGRRR